MWSYREDSSPLAHHQQRPVNTFTSILYYSMAPAVILVPLWFLIGRVLMGGTSEFYGEFLLGDLCIWGVVFFHILILGWELQSRPTHQRSTGIAVALLCGYVLHFWFQIFFFDEDYNHEDGWSVASKYWGISREVSKVISFFLALGIWMLMVAMLLKSFWTIYPNSDSTTPQVFDMNLVCQRMKDTLKPATLLVWLWFGLGHSVLGGGFGWGGMNLLIGGAPIFIPFHTILWYREQHHETISTNMGLALMAYYALHFADQTFEVEGYRTGASVASTFFGRSFEASAYITVVFYAMMLVTMVYIMTLSCS